MTIPRAVLDLRTHLGLDGSEFGKVVGKVSRQAVSYWESGETTPRATHLSAMIGLAHRSGAAKGIAEALENALGDGEARA